MLKVLLIILEAFFFCVCVCVRGLHGPGPGPTSGPGRQMRSDFFQWAKQGRQRRNILSNGPGRAEKREMVFLTAGLGYKKKNTNNIARQSIPT